MKNLKTTSKGWKTSLSCLRKNSTITSPKTSFWDSIRPSTTWIWSNHTWPSNSHARSRQHICLAKKQQRRLFCKNSFLNRPYLYLDSHDVCSSIRVDRPEPPLPSSPKSIVFYITPLNKINLLNRSSFSIVTTKLDDRHYEIGINPKNSAKRIFVLLSVCHWPGHADWILRSSSFKWWLKRDKYALMYDWVEYFNNTHGLHIQHKLNMAKENKIGPYPVYGFDAQKPPCINFTNMTGMEKIVDGKDSQRTEIVPRTTGQERQDHQNVDLEKDAGNILSSKNGNVDVKARFEETTSWKPSVIPGNHRHHNVLSQNTKFQKLFRTIASLEWWNATSKFPTYGHRIYNLLPWQLLNITKICHLCFVRYYRRTHAG